MIIGILTKGISGKIFIISLIAAALFQLVFNNSAVFLIAITIFTVIIPFYFWRFGRAGRIIGIVISVFMFLMILKSTAIHIEILKLKKIINNIFFQTELV